MEEMLTALKRTFTAIDGNTDCYINLTDIISVLDESGLPEDFQLGVRLLGQRYITHNQAICGRLYCNVQL